MVNICNVFRKNSNTAYAITLKLLYNVLLFTLVTIWWHKQFVT